MKGESVFISDLLFYGLTGISGVVLGWFLYGKFHRINLRSTRETAQKLLERAEKESSRLKKEATFVAKKDLYELRSKFDNNIKRKEDRLQKFREQLFHKEKQLKKMSSETQQRAEKQAQKNIVIQDQQQRLKEKEKRLSKLIDEENQKLGQITNVSQEEAKKILMKNLEIKAKVEAAQLRLEIKNRAIDEAKRESKKILATCIEKMASEYTVETTLVSVPLPDDKYKGMIIGKEGVNIRAFEAASGVKVIVDDTPETIVMSSFDPIKREIARRAMERMIKTKAIYPKEIESALRRAKDQVDSDVELEGRRALKKLKIYNVHPEMRNWLGRLKYRSSYGQNMLQHSVEVARLSGSMAWELGLDAELAKRAGLFHDIGKAGSVELEGSHVSIGVDIATRCKEHEVVINSILAHHEEAPPISPISVLVTAADKISGARPGARRESLEAYSQRITKLEEIATSFEGVSKTYALSAGREIRVIIEPEKLSDAKADWLASEIASKIKETMEYPGQVKVTVIRETSYTKFTQRGKNKSKNHKYKVQSKNRRKAKTG